MELSLADMLPPILMISIPILYCVIDKILDFRTTKRRRKEKKCRSTTNIDQKASKK